MKKRILALAMLLALLMTLTGCAPEKKVEKAINAIGEVKLSAREVIEYADSLYSQLDVSKKVKVTNKNTLERAKSELKRQLDLADKAQKAVDAIGTVTLSSSDAIMAAREAFDLAIPYDDAGILTGAENTLLAAEQKLAQLEEEALTMLEDAKDLYSRKKYAEAADLLNKNFDLYVEQGQGYECGTLLVQCLCGHAQQEFNLGNGLEAVELLYEAMDLEDYCDTVTFANINKLYSSFANDLNKKAPKNETVIKRTKGAGANYAKVKVGNYDTVVKLELIDDPSQYVMTYIRANEDAIIYVLNGDYKVKYTCGPIWFGEDDLFGDFATFWETGDILNMAGYTKKVGKSYIQDRGRYSGELTDGYGNDWGIQNITPDMF